MVKFPAALSLLALLTAPATAQMDRVDLTADRLIHESGSLHGIGRARARCGDLVLQADDAVLHTDTGALEMRGHVHITLPARDDHTVVRYGAAVLLTDQPIGITADRATLKNGLLQTAGNIIVVPTDPEMPDVRLRGDELAMFLKIADGTLRGNVRTTNISEPPLPRPGIRVPRPVFPPDIIK